MAWSDSEKLVSVGTPHPHGPLKLSTLLNQICRDVWDYSHRRNLNPLTSCPLMRSLVSVGVSVKCLLNNSRLMAGHGGGREEGQKGGAEHVAGGWGSAWQVHVGVEKEEKILLSSILSLVSLRQFVFMLRKGLNSLLRNFSKGVRLWKLYSQGTLQNNREYSDLTELSVFHELPTICLSYEQLSKPVHYYKWMRGLMSNWCHMLLPVSQPASVWPPADVRVLLIKEWAAFSPSEGQVAP